MEKSSLCSNLKQQSRNTKQIYDFKVKGSSWDFGNEADLVAAGFSWPPRSYICSFCKREFRSAQALGGHMNVHRRDRARLRQSPTRSDGGKFSPLNLNLEPNPNPSFNSNPSSCPSNSPSYPPPFSSLLTKFPQFASKFPPVGPLPAEMMKPKATKALFGVERFDSWANEKGGEDFKKRDFVRLDLEIGLIRESKEEQLDLELRLGYT
ncbi:hypothetical protein ACS0TY_014397 [Phlomoides rotata]